MLQLQKRQSSALTWGPLTLEHGNESRQGFAQLVPATTDALLNTSTPTESQVPVPVNITCPPVLIAARSMAFQTLPTLELGRSNAYQPLNAEQLVVPDVFIDTRVLPDVVGDAWANTCKMVPVYVLALATFVRPSGIAITAKIYVINLLCILPGDCMS